ncbi:peptidase M16 family protein [Streptomyces marincola]|uniref:hypothetical protein n=1 Tax=Streptomyces marincola TaxID=2878388 RepID=UPI001CF185E7|nr:hypothetical protein [Streptomyces marincola]UCM88681.1 hypothetical protein LC193_12345 [Streptomyces marincola]
MVSRPVEPSAARDGTVCGVQRYDAIRSLRCFGTAGPRPRMRVEVTGAFPGRAGDGIVRDALVIPRVLDFWAGRGSPRVLADHGTPRGVEVTPPAIDPPAVWRDAAVLHAAVREALVHTVRDDGADRALVRAVAARTRTSHDIAALATRAFRAAEPTPDEPTRLRSDRLAARVLDDARRLLDNAPVHAPRIAAGVAITAGRPQGPGRAGGAMPGDLAIRLPRGLAPRAWTEVESPRAELAHVQIRRPIPRIGTVRALAAVLVANQAAFGPYSSAVDGVVRVREALTYLWDCVIDLGHGEFVMLAAPDAADADRLIALVRGAHEEVGTAHALATARRIARTALLRRTGPPDQGLALQSEAQQSCLPAEFVASLLAALRDVTAREVDAALPAVLAEPLSVTLVVPSAR